jgi:predicted dehydrogenase
MENGIIFDYRGSWCANGLGTSWESEWRVGCADGAVYWDGADKLFYETTDGASFDIDTPKMEFEGHEACINDMFDCLESGSRPSTDCRDNIFSMKMVHKAIESSRRKALVKIK